MTLADPPKRVEWSWSVSLGNALSVLTVVSVGTAMWVTQSAELETQGKRLASLEAQAEQRDAYIAQLIDQNARLQRIEPVVTRAEQRMAQFDVLQARAEARFERFDEILRDLRDHLDRLNAERDQ